MTAKTGGACPKCGEPYTPFPVHMCLRPYGPLKGDKQPSRGDHMTAKERCIGCENRQWQIDFMCGEIAKALKQPTTRPAATVSMVRSLMLIAEDLKARAADETIPIRTITHDPDCDLRGRCKCGERTAAKTGEGL